MKPANTFTSSCKIGWFGSSPNQRSFSGLSVFASLRPVSSSVQSAESSPTALDRQRLVTLSCLLNLFQSLAFAALIFSGLLQVWHIVGLAIFMEL